MPKPASTHTLQQEANAARSLKDALAAIPNMDDDTVRDTIEGETSLHEAIAAVLADIDEDEMLVAGIGTMVGRLSERRTRLENRTEARKAAIQKAMEIGVIQKLVTPSGTLSLRNTPRGLEITDEAAVPFDYFIPQPAKLDRKKLKDDLKDGKDVPGAVLGNGGVTISIRRT
jgi:hypothetical protein